MKIGVVKESKVLEGRVALIPAACGELVQLGHEVYLQRGAGELSGYSDADYQAQGVSLCDNAQALYAAATLIVKVKEPVAGDLACLGPQHILFCYLHLAASPELTDKLCGIGLTAIAFETVTDAAGGLPLLKPMSEIAGKLATQIGTHLLHQPQGGRGILLGGLSNTDRGHVVVLGAGVAGSAAARLAAAMGAEISLIDRDASRFAPLQDEFSHVQGIMSSEAAISEAVQRADLLVGAVLLPGLHAPRLVTESQVKSMRPGSVIIDISVDQGGCIETIRPTDYSKPTYTLHDVLHFGVTNMPGAVPRTASQALSAAILPYVKRLCEAGWEQQADLQNGVNIRAGRIDNPLIAQAMANHSDTTTDK